jgi:D-amino-acid dehydrogenase
MTGQRVIVFGGGVVGVTTAYFLAADGHTVELLERRSTLAPDASSGNAGLIAPGHAITWASPEAPRMLLRAMMGSDSVISLKRLDRELLVWGIRFLRECTARKHHRNTLSKFHLSQYSQKVLDELVASEQLDYGKRSDGILYIYRDRHEMEKEYEAFEILRQHGQEMEMLDAADCVRHEPALAGAKDRIAGAVFNPTDASGNCESFTNVLARRCREMGVRIRMGTAVHRLEHDADRITGAVIDGGVLRADAYVVALGVDSRRLARTAGYRLPIYPAKGYSATFPIREEHHPPVLSGIDAGPPLVGWANFGDSLRMASTAEFTGYGRDWTSSDFSGILQDARDLFPDAADFSEGQYRACLRPMTPAGPPIIGRGRHRNLLFNTGHGNMGWTMACGSARILADIFAQRQTEISLENLGSA